MQAERWERVFTICRTAFEGPDDQRASWLDQACGHDAALRADVESLLALDAGAGAFLEPPPSSDVSSLLEPALAGAAIGRRVGAYTIQRVIGRGGMGIVYEAHQDNPRRVVALKVIRALPYADDLTARLFAREGRALARLQHPGIAAIYEAGHTDDAWYFLAMERVDGIPLTRYAREHALSLRQRLELVRLVCDAVQFAHQRGVIHRDLKPSNILVTEEGQPKILDFGLARIIDQEGEASQFTQSGGFQGTLAYASPEQTRGKPLDVDARTDVYSLGVILYELATDEHPYEVSGLTIAEAVRVICELTPKPAGMVRRALRGDVETILRKALEKDPERRYVSAAALGDDVERFLRGRPILAHPPSVLYQVRKVAARHKMPLALLTILMVGLVAATVWLSIVYSRVLLAEHNAQIEASTAARTKAFLLDVFSAHDPDVEAGKPQSAEQLLERGAARALTELADEPLVQAELLDTMGTVLGAHDRLQQAADLLERAFQSRRRLLGTDHPLTGTSSLHLADAYSALNRFPEAEERYRSAVEIFTKAHGERHAATARAISGLGNLVRARDLAEAAALHRRALAIQREVLGDRHDDTLEAMTDLAIDLRRLEQYDEAESLLREALAARLALFGEDRVSVAHTYQSLAVLLRNRKRYAEAEENYLNAQRIYRKLLGDRHRYVADNISNLGLLYLTEGDPRKAAEMYRSSLDLHRAIFGDANMSVARVLDLLGQVLRNQLDDPEAALVVLRESYEIRCALLPKEHPDYGQGVYQLASTMLALNRFEEAAALCGERIDLDVARGRDPNLDAKMDLCYGESLARLERHSEAVGPLERSVELSRKRAAPDDPDLLWAQTVLAQTYAALGRSGDAEELLLTVCTALETPPAQARQLQAHPARYAGTYPQALESLVRLYELRGATDEAARWHELLAGLPPAPQAADRR